MKKKPARKVTPNRRFGKQSKKRNDPSDFGQGKRLQRVMAEAGVCSRRKAEELITSGRVTVDGAVVTQLGTRVLAAQKIAVDGKRIQQELKHFYRFFKPRSVLTTMSDPHGRKCVANFVKELPVRVFPVGRLDYDVSGLVLLTNDGDLMEKILHPRFETERVYIARVKAPLTDERRKMLLRGVELEDGKAVATKVRSVLQTEDDVAFLGEAEGNSNYVEITVNEGRNHFVKRLLSSVGCDVERLCRTRIGEYSIHGMKPGEIKELRETSMGERPRNSHRKRPEKPRARVTDTEKLVRPRAEPRGKPRAKPKGPRAKSTADSSKPNRAAFASRARRKAK